jgi:hypothetical protein
VDTLESEHSADANALLALREMRAWLHGSSRGDRSQ